MSTSSGDQTLEEFAQSLMRDWRFPDDWVAWPPDLFAFTSSVLARTGAYRDIVNQPWSLDQEWQSHAEGMGEGWLQSINRELCAARPDGEKPDCAADRPVRDDFRTLDELRGQYLQRLGEMGAAVTMGALRTLEDEQARDAAQLLLRLHAVADEACTGFGLLGSVRPETALAQCAADLLLTAKGSLSRLPKHVGVVVPKLRTPQAGLTARSLAHHVTFHMTEVEVVWRTMPWPNTEENTLNLLAIPWPPRVNLAHFKPLNDNFQNVRYFSYRPAEDDSQILPAGRIVATLREIEQGHCPVHLLAFPESSLTLDEYRALLLALKAAGDRDDADGEGGGLKRVPMLVVGIHRREDDKDINEVRLASYFAGRWYEMVQRKHHRWRLDRSQIRQYGLEGRFATARNWYEHIALSQRRLTFLAPNGWLALCPLICEDLAQLEPVSEVIRGVGPTLLISLLADGPQLTSRWSARYASVLADDPGTAVLTMTSLGMVAQSRDPNAPDRASGDRTIALWKDQVHGWRPIRLDPDHDAVLLTISSDWHMEYTADGRGDHQNAAGFKFEGVRGIRLAAAPEADGQEPDIPAPPATGDEDRLTARWDDMRELSAATFALNAMLHLRRRADIARVLEWLRASDSVQTHAYPPALRELVDQVVHAQRSPEQIGIRAHKESEWPTRSMKLACDTIWAFFSDLPQDDLEYWPAMVKRATDRLDAAPGESDPQNPGQRMEWGIPYSVLTCIHAVLETARRPRHTRHAELPSDPRSARRIQSGRAATLFHHVEEALARYRYRPPAEVAGSRAVAGESAAD